MWRITVDFASRELAVDPVMSCRIMVQQTRRGSPNRVVTAASVFFLVFAIPQAKHDFFEAFQQTFQLAAVLAFVTAGL